jgi:hypothetical protein
MLKKIFFKSCLRVSAGLLASLFFLNLTACTPRLNGLFQDPSFTYDSMSQEGFAIGGVAIPTPTTHTGTDPAIVAQESHYAELLREGVLNARPGILIMPAGEVAQTLGEKYDTMITYYAYRDVTADEYLKLIKAKTTHIRYVMFASIPVNATSQAMFDNGDSMSYASYRTVTASAKIYDLVTNQIVWSGSLTQTAQNTSTYVTTEIQNPQNSTEAIASSVITGLEKNQIQKNATYPTPPDTLPVISGIFNAMGENLPKPVKKKKA